MNKTFELAIERLMGMKSESRGGCVCRKKTEEISKLIF